MASMLAILALLPLPDDTIHRLSNACQHHALGVWQGDLFKKVRSPLVDKLHEIGQFFPENRAKEELSPKATILAWTCIWSSMLHPVGPLGGAVRITGRHPDF